MHVLLIDSVGTSGQIIKYQQDDIDRIFNRLIFYQPLHYVIDQQPHNDLAALIPEVIFSRSELLARSCYALLAQPQSTMSCDNNDPLLYITYID